MGYTTEFDGRLDLNKELTAKDAKWLQEFSGTRHGGNMEHDKDKPGFWCQWVPTEDFKGIEWDGNEKFYDYVEWLEYLIENFFAPKGYVLNGKLRYQGEEMHDAGWITVSDNIVSVRELS